jgi:hypothetical protein
MRPSYVRRRVDDNQIDVVQALRAAGAKVQSLAAVGCGCPDLLVAYKGRLYLMEVKQAGKKLTEDEAKWHRAWPLRVDVVTSAEEALWAIGAVFEVS